jgi:hypothetical protein
MSDESNLDMFLKDTALPPVAESPPVAEAVPDKVEAKVETVVETKEEPKGEVAAPPAAERPRDESGRFVKQHTEDHMVPLSALLSERERRQAAEAKAAEVAKPVPDIWEDPKAYLKAELDSRETELLRKAEERARLTFFSYTEEAARSRHSDYDQVREAFAEEAQKNPAIASQLAQAPDPGEFIYRQGKTVLELKEVGGDLAAYRKRIENEVRQRVEKELAERLAKTSNIPQSLNTEPSKGAGVVGAAWAGPTPLEDILPKR